MIQSKKMSSADGKRTALLITNIPTPYRIPLFNELQKQLQEKDMRLKVVFGAKGYARRKWQIDFSEFKFDYEILNSSHLRFFNKEKVRFTYPGLFRIIGREKPEVVISNAFSIASTKLWLRSFFHNTPPYIIWSGAIARADKPENWLRKIQRRALVKRASGFISYGTLAKRYLVSLGAPENNINIALNTVDTEFFAKETTRIRETLPSDGTKHLLYVGDLSPRKNVIKLLKVAEALKKRRNDFVLDLVGDGLEREILKSYAKENNLENIILFHGFKQKKELPSFYARADCFLFQTDFDIWGLVLVEAMAAGVLCIASKKAGAVQDLVINRETGFIADFHDYEYIAGKINYVLNNPKIALEIAKNASELIRNKINIKTTAGFFLQSLLKVKKA